MFCTLYQPEGAAFERQELESRPEEISPGKVNSETTKDEVTESKLIKIIQLLQMAAPRLNLQDADITRQDRLGRSAVHIAAQYGLVQLLQTLLKPVNEGGLGAN